MAPIVLCTAIAAVVVVVAAAAASDDDEEYHHHRSSVRSASKPWLMKEFELVTIPDALYKQIKNTIESQEWFDPSIVLLSQTIYASPFTIGLVVLAVANLWSWISYHTSGSWVEASHLLVKDTSPKTLKALNGLRDQLGNDAKMFGQAAKSYSQCPSSEQKGDLGRFGPGTMAPPFDHLCFDPATPLHETIGPVQTQFGYHLIYIRTRKF